jgi:hypothetical protein
MHCNLLLILKMNQDKLKAMFPHASAATLKRNLEFDATLERAEAKSSPPPDAKPLFFGHQLAGSKSKNKYHNVKVEYEGMKFDSKHELACWKQLKLREKAGEICGLIRQEAFELEVNGKRIGKFTADFAWYENGQRIIADAKSEITRKETSYRLRKLIFEAIYAPLVICEL